MTIKYVELKGEEGFTRLLAGPPETSGMKSGYVTLKPGESVGPHATTGREEEIVLLSGTAAVIIGEQQPFLACAPGIVYIPPETGHDIRNDGPGILKYVYVVTPAK